MSAKLSVYIGFDPREPKSYAVTRESIRRTSPSVLRVRGIILDRLRKQGLYNREHVKQDGRLYDVISDAPMSTEFAISRFLTPYMNEYSDYALFMDSDMLVKQDLSTLFQYVRAEPGKAVYCVQHEHNPENLHKMDGQLQTLYKRKNWSSVMLFYCAHPSNKNLTPELVNRVPGRDLHAFCWLKDSEIGRLPKRFNYLVGHTVLPPSEKPDIIHWTDGSPEFPGYEDVEYADEFNEMYLNWAE